MSTPSRTDSPSRQSSQPTEGGQSKSEMDIFESPPSSVANDSSGSDRGRPMPAFVAAPSSSRCMPISTHDYHRRPLFPDGTMPLRLNTTMDAASTTRKDTSAVLSALDDLINGKRSFKFESMAAMIEAHTEELRKRPLRGAMEDPTSTENGKHGNGEAGFQGEDSKADEKPAPN